MVQDGQRAAPDQGRPALVCICGLCECGGHKCSDFDDWFAAQNGERAGGQLDHADSRSGSETAEGAAVHSCSYTRAAAPLDERYLTRTAAPAQHEPARHDRPVRSTTPRDGRTGRPAEDEVDAEILHVLVTRPQVAARPHDNIVFEGDMDLRTTFETSYEALARARLEHWRRHQALRAQRRLSGQADVSVAADGDQNAAPAAGPDDAPGEPSPSGHARDAPKLRRPPRIEQEADGSSGGGQPDVERHRRQQDPFIDPDLSPIIVYDANLNRLERVGLRKRSKYRPSTSLRPGGRGFFGAAEVEAGDGQRITAAGTDLEGKPRVAGSARLPADRAAAGATSETLNRGSDGCGRKHHHGHANCVDHIGQMNLPEARRPDAGDENNNENNNEPQSGGRVELAAGDDERQLALDEEAAAVAEIQRLVVTNDHDGGHLQQVESRQAAPANASRSSRLTRHATIASPAEAAAVAAATTANNGAPRSSSRSSRMERVCQNQSFYLFENDYPAARDETSGDRQWRTTNGGRDTVELSRPSHLDNSQGVRVRQNLFRESPDFIMTTGQVCARLGAEEAAQVRQIESRNSVSQDNATKPQHESVTLGEDHQDHDVGESRVEPSKCPVLKLGREFEFMGSKCGHKFFIEKHVTTTPINEIG